MMIITKQDGNEQKEVDFTDILLTNKTLKSEHNLANGGGGGGSSLEK